jgi:uncharacterized cupredoxin-like copper-binding protein
MKASCLSLVALAVAALAVTGCGGDDEEGGEAATEGTATEEAAAPSKQAAATVKISETDFKLDPANPKVDKAGTVEFRVSNDGKTVHALEVEGPKGEVETENLSPGKSATLKADLSEPGSYTMYCPVGNHRQQGMEGKVTVAGGGSGGGASTEKEDEKKEDDSGGASGY